MDKVMQLSVFSENKPGRIQKITRIFGEEGINILAISITSTNGFGIIKLLVDKQRIGVLPDIEICYRQMMDEALKKVRVNLKTAFPLSAGIQAYISSNLEKLTGRQVEMTVEKDPALLGGIVIGVGDTIYDGSIKNQLNNMRNLLGEAR